MQHLLFPTVTLNRDLLAVCTCGSAETAAAVWLLWDTARQSTRSVFLEETAVLSPALWMTGHPPSLTFLQMHGHNVFHSTLQSWHSCCLRSMSPCWASVSHGRRGLCYHQLDAFLSRKLPFPSFLYFYLHFIEHPLLTGNEFKYPAFMWPNCQYLKLY